MINIRYIRFTVFIYLNYILIKCRYNFFFRKTMFGIHTMKLYPCFELIYNIRYFIMFNSKLCLNQILKVKFKNFTQFDHDQNVRWYMCGFYNRFWKKSSLLHCFSLLLNVNSCTAMQENKMEKNMWHTMNCRTLENRRPIYWPLFINCHEIDRISTN